MSVSFTEPDLQPTYEAVRDATADYDWAIFNQTGNELKVQATGSGLEDLEEEFMDGRIQYAFARVKDPNVSDSRWTDGRELMGAEQAGQVCAGVVVRGRCARDEEGLLPFAHLAGA